jgi:hypothetical protein
VTQEKKARRVTLDHLVLRDPLGLPGQAHHLRECHSRRLSAFGFDSTRSLGQSCDPITDLPSSNSTRGVFSRVFLLMIVGLSMRTMPALGQLLTRRQPFGTTEHASAQNEEAANQLSTWYVSLAACLASLILL